MGYMGCVGCLGWPPRVHGVLGVPTLAPTHAPLLACPKTCVGPRGPPLLFDLPARSPKAGTESVRLSRPVAPTGPCPPPTHAPPPPGQPWAGRRGDSCGSGPAGCRGWRPPPPRLPRAMSPVWRRGSGPGAFGHPVSLGSVWRRHLRPAPRLEPGAFVSARKSSKLGNPPCARPRDWASPWHGHPWGPKGQRAGARAPVGSQTRGAGPSPVAAAGVRWAPGGGGRPEQPSSPRRSSAPRPWGSSRRSPAAPGQGRRLSTHPHTPQLGQPARAAPRRDPGDGSAGRPPLWVNR